MPRQLDEQDELDILKEVGLDPQQWKIVETSPIIPGHNPPPLLGEDEVSLQYPAHHLPTNMLSARAQSTKPQSGIPVRALWPVQAPGKANANSAIVSQVGPVKKSAEAAQTAATNLGNTSVVSVNSSGNMQQGSLKNLPVAPKPVAPVTQDNLNDGLNFKRVLHVNADNTFHVSTAFNNHGNIPASALVSGAITVKTGTTSGASMTVVWGGSVGGLMDGSSIVLGIGGYSAPGAPTLTQHSGGTRGATTLFVRLALVRDNMILAVGPESSIAVSANNQISVTSPSSVAGMDGWLPLIGTASNNEFVVHDRVSGGNPLGFFPVAFGTNYSEPSGGFTTAGQTTVNWANNLLPTASSTSVNPCNPLLSVSTTHFLYPSYDLVNQMICFPAFPGFNAGINTAKSPFVALGQCGDQKIALSTGAFSFTTPVANSSSSATGAGGGGGGRALQ